MAGAVAEEVLGGIRTVVAFGGEQKESERFNERLKSAEVNGIKKGLYTGLGIGIMWLITYCAYGVALWYGTELVIAERDSEHRHYTANTIVIVSEWDGGRDWIVKGNSNSPFRSCSQP